LAWTDLVKPRTSVRFTDDVEEIWFEFLSNAVARSLKGKGKFVPVLN